MADPGPAQLISIGAGGGTDSSIQYMGTVRATLIDAYGYALNTTANNIPLANNDPSPVGPGTRAGNILVGMQVYTSLFIYANLTGGVGGTLDVYIQVSPDGGTTWVDYIHFPQVPAGVNVKYALTVARSSEVTSAAFPVGIGNNPALAPGAIVGGDFTDRMRVLYVAGAGTTASAPQQIIISGKS